MYIFGDNYFLHQLFKGHIGYNYSFKIAILYRNLTKQKTGFFKLRYKVLNQY